MRILIVDDERNIRKTLGACLRPLGHDVREAAGAAEAIEMAAAQRSELVLLDLRLGADDGLELIAPLSSEHPWRAVVVITAHASFESAVEAIKRGAEDYLPKPFSPAQVRHLVERVEKRLAMSRRIETLEDTLAHSLPTVELGTGVPAMEAALEVVARAAASDVALLLRGESGTGKGVVARYLHDRSGRRERPFVVVNCPTLSEELLASELFGHARGAFTGAVRDTPGRVEAADGGTLFLDEIGELSPALQAKLLRFLQDKEFERVGESRTRRGDVRIVAASNRNIEADVEAGRFRLDLLYRLNVVEVELPPLRARGADIVALAEHFLAFFAAQLGRRAPSLDEAARAALSRYAWPGNLRELRNEMERALVLTDARILSPASFSERIVGAAVAPRAQESPMERPMTLEEVERRHIARVLAEAETLEGAAEILGIDASTLWRKRKRYGLEG